MATARCYTKSGNKELHEPDLWNTPTSQNWSHYYIVGTVTTPDTLGNYTVTPAQGYEDSNTQTELFCTTIYGGYIKRFYFKKNTSIHIKILINVLGYRDYAGNLVFNCTASSDNSEIATSVLSNNTIILSYEVVTRSGPVGSYSVRVKYGDNLLSPGIKYAEDKTYYIDVTTSPATVNPSSGTYSEYNWNISVITASV